MTIILHYFQHQRGSIQVMLILHPLAAPARNVRTIALGSEAAYPIMKCNIESTAIWRECMYLPSR